MTHEERHDQNNDREAIEANEAIGTVAESSTRNREKCIRAFLVAHSEMGDSQQLDGRSAGVEQTQSAKMASYAAVVMRWRVAQKRTGRLAGKIEQRSRGSRVSRHSGLCCLEMGIRLGRSQSRRVVKCRAWQSAKMRW